VDVEQQLAAGARGDGSDELPFGHGIAAEAQVRRDVLDQDRAPERTLYFVDAVAHDIQCFVGEGQRQQVVKVTSVDVAPAQMLRDGGGLDAIGQALQLQQVSAV